MRLEGVQMGTIYPSNDKKAGQGSQDKNIKQGEKGVGEIQPGERVIPEEQLINAIEKGNESFQVFDRRFERSVHEKTGSVMIKVINSTNDEVIREIPSEKMLDMVANMLEVAGVLVDKRI